jgi:hypothetical protein
MKSKVKQKLARSEPHQREDLHSESLHLYY